MWVDLGERVNTRGHGVYLRVSRGGCWRWSGGCARWGELVDPRRVGELERGEDGALRGGELGALAEGPGGACEGADLDPVQFAAQGGPGGGAGSLDDPGEQQRQPAQGDVGADALLQPVGDRAQGGDLFQ